MAGTYTEQAALAADPTFLGRVTVAIVRRAILVVQETPQPPNHTQRVAHAQRVTGSPQGWAKQMVWGVVSDPTITAQSTDAAIDTQVSGMWDTYATS